MTTNNLAVALTDVTKTYGSHTAVSDLSLSVPRGSIYGFIGPNGSGKTTTIRMILHILRADSGSVEVLGQSETRAANDRIGYLPEERGLYKKMKVLNLLQYYAELKGMNPKDAKRDSIHWLERMEIPQWGSKKIESLSKGMAQKVQFIATILARPELVILDEPFSGLDPVNLETIRSAILDLQREGTTIIFSTHDMSMAEKLCSSIFMIHKGQKVLDGTLAEIKANYGQDSIRLQIPEGAAALEGIPGIERIIDMGKYLEVKLQGDSNEFLKTLLQRTRVQRFEEAEPSLHDIFTRIAQPQKEAAHHE